MEHTDFPKEDEILYQTRSSEAQEIIGRMPSWIIQYGVTIIGMLLVLIFIGAAFIKYPDVVKVRFIILISDHPQKISSQTSGTIFEVFVQDGEKVLENQNLIILKDSANINDILAVKFLTRSIDTSTVIPLDVLMSINQKMKLGALQPMFYDFLIAVSNYQKYASVSRSSLFQIEQELRMQTKIFIQHIKKWEDIHLIKSPITGSLSFIKPLEREYNVNANELLMTVSPPSKSNIVTVGVLPGRDIIRVKVNQQIFLKLDNYPHQDFGIIKGKIAKITALDSNFIINVQLENGLTTSNNFKIPTQIQLSATGEIQIEDKTVLQQLFSQLTPSQ